LSARPAPARLLAAQLLAVIERDADAAGASPGASLARSVALSVSEA